jgi:hypothetical protein
MPPKSPERSSSSASKEAAFSEAYESKGDGGSAVPAGGTVLNLSEYKQAEGRGLLTRIMKDKEGKEVLVDFWHDVVRFDSAKLEAVLKLAKTDEAYDLTQFIRGIEYQGFDREFYIRHALSKMSISLFARFAVLGAIRGSNFARIVETCEIMPQDMISGYSSIGFVRTPKKKDHITILRNTASIPHWCAYYMQKAKVDKKIPVECPAELQFPGAASLPMSKGVRLQHLEFCSRFSALLPGGSFSVTIYLTAMSNLINVSDIPQEILSVLKVSSVSESHTLSQEEIGQHTSQAVVKK